MAIRVLIINRQLVTAVTIKQALEQTTLFVVRPFTTADAAFDFLREHPQDVALVDFDLPGRSGAKVVQQLRSLQPDIAVIVSPKQPDKDVAHLNLNGMLDMPYTTRDILPLIETALKTTINYPSQTRRIGDEPPISGQATTRGLSKKGDAPLNTQFGKTLPLDPQHETGEGRGGTAILPEMPVKPPRKPAGTEQPPPLITHILNDAPPLPPEPTHTRLFEENVAPSNEPAQTYLFGDDVPAWTPQAESEPLDYFADDAPPWMQTPVEPAKYTRILDPNDLPENASGTHILDEPTVEASYAPPSLAGTRLLGEGFEIEAEDAPFADEHATVPNNAEFTPLDDVLRSFGLDVEEVEIPPPPDDTSEYVPRFEGGTNKPPRRPSKLPESFEPPTVEGDTPAVPMQDSDAVRQFLATSDSHPQTGRFDDVLDAITPDDVKPKHQQQVDFEGLVRSLSSEQAHKPLPSRQQDSLDMILSTGMESLLREIEKTKTGPLPVKPESLPEQPKKTGTPPKTTSRMKAPKTPPLSASQQLAAEEPDLPTFAESGTVSDLLVGVTDSSFRNVIALLSGEELPPPEETPEEDPFADFFKPQDPPQQAPSGTPEQRHIPSVRQRTQQPQPTAQNFDFDALAANEPEPDEEASVASVVLQTALQERTPSGFSIDNLLADIQERLTEHQIRIRPLPSWDMDTSAFRAVVEESRPKTKTKPRKPPTIPEGDIREPSFLPDTLPPGQVVPSVSSDASSTFYSDDATQPAASFYETIQNIPADSETRLDVAVSGNEPEELSWMADLVQAINVPTTAPSIEAEWLPDSPEADFEAPPIESEQAQPVSPLWLPDQSEDAPLQAQPISDFDADFATLNEIETPQTDEDFAALFGATTPAPYETEPPAILDGFAALFGAEAQPAPDVDAHLPTAETDGTDDDFAMLFGTATPAYDAPLQRADDDFATLFGTAEPTYDTPAQQTDDDFAVLFGADEPAYSDDAPVQQTDDNFAVLFGAAEPAYDAPAQQTDDDFAALFQNQPSLEDMDFHAPIEGLENIEFHPEQQASTGYSEALDAILSAQQANEAVPGGENALVAPSAFEDLMSSLVSTSPVSPQSSWDQPLVNEGGDSGLMWDDGSANAENVAPAFLGEWAAPADWTPDKPVPAFSDIEIDPNAKTPFADDLALTVPNAAPAPGEWSLSEETPSSAPQLDEWSLPASSGASEEMPPLTQEDAYLAQLALNLTQMSLEISAEATLITRADEIVAYAGHLSKVDAQELRHAINNDFQTDPEGARLRFIVLPSSGKEYMLYSIETVGDLVLSLIFAGTTPIRTIRQQGQRLLDALAAVPETVAMPEAHPVETPAISAQLPVEESPLTLEPFTYLWLLRDPHYALTEDVGEAIITGLRMQLRERRWKIQDVQAAEDYVYMQVEVPPDLPANQVIHDLKSRSAEIAHAQNPDLTPQLLWADGYLLLTPGRGLSVEEIQEFINFQRMM
jgi:CheY-like chemotaxis protein/REP element-mobilizing transposase RayT